MVIGTDMDSFNKMDGTRVYPTESALSQAAERGVMCECLALLGQHHAARLDKLFRNQAVKVYATG